MTPERCSLSCLNSAGQLIHTRALTHSHAHTRTQVAEIEAIARVNERGQDGGKIGPSWQNKDKSLCFSSAPGGSVQMFQTSWWAALGFIYSSVKEKLWIRQNQTFASKASAPSVSRLGDFDLYEERGEDWNRWQESPWANDAYPNEHWELLTIWTKSNEQHPLSGFPTEKNWKKETLAAMSPTDCPSVPYENMVSRINTAGSGDQICCSSFAGMVKICGIGGWNKIHLPGPQLLTISDTSHRE